MSNPRGSLFVLSGPSGVGKSTVIAALLKRRSNLSFSVSLTTREPRPGEIDGVNYHFVTRDEFERMIANHKLLEHASYVENYYGTSLACVEERLDAGTDVLLDIEVQGAMQVHTVCPEAIMIFLAPPSLEELERRLRNRNTDSEEKIARRLQRAREEYSKIDHYDYIVINNDVLSSAMEIDSIITAEHCRTHGRIQLIREAKQCCIQL